jgi:hypothetical protein
MLPVQYLWCGDLDWSSVSRNAKRGVLEGYSQGYNCSCILLHLYLYLIAAAQELSIGSCDVTVLLLKKLKIIMVIESFITPLR